MMHPRARTGVFLLLICATFLSLRGVRMSLKSFRKQPVERVSANEERLRALRRHLPARGVIGFLEAPSDHRKKPGKQHFLTRYALAPLVVLPFSNQDIAVVNTYDLSWRPSLQGYRMQKDFGNGVLVFVKEIKAIKNGPDGTGIEK